MYINVPNKKLEKILKSEKNIKKVYNKLDKRIMMRINTLQAVENLSLVPTDKPERCHLLDGKYYRMFCSMYRSNWRMIIKPRDYEMPYDKSKIKEIDIIKIR